MRTVRSDLKSIVGKRFGRWVVLSRDIGRSINRKTFYICKCDCGLVKSIRSDLLRNGESKSCGCYKRSSLSARTRKHGLTGHKLYKTWVAMKQRCYNPKEKRYKNYGKRGIIVCDEWKNDFKKFYDWSMANGYASYLTIDRINNNGNYDPGNCRFISNEL